MLVAHLTLMWRRVPFRQRVVGAPLQLGSSGDSERAKASFASAWLTAIEEARTLEDLRQALSESVSVAAPALR